MAAMHAAWIALAIGQAAARGRGPASQARVQQGGRLVGLVEGADVGAGWDDLVDDVEAAFIAEVADQAGAAQVVALVLAHAAGEQALAERAPDQGTHAEALDAGQDLALDAAVEQGVGRLLGAEPFEAAPFGDPLDLDDAGRKGLRRPIARTLPLRIRSVSAERVSSMSVPGSGR